MYSVVTNAAEASGHFMASIVLFMGAPSGSLILFGEFRSCWGQAATRLWHMNSVIFGMHGSDVYVIIVDVFCQSLN